MPALSLVPVAGGALEVELIGEGEPVLVVQTALDADELRPLGAELARAGGLRVVHVHRRGYADSSPASGRRSIDAEADDAARVLRALGLGPVHLVGASFSAAIALALARARPELVRTVSVVEAPPCGTPGAPEFRAVNRHLRERHAAEGAEAALDHLMTMLSGENWRELADRDRPGAVSSMRRDAGTFFEEDLPALLGWRFGPEDADLVRAPVLLVGGGETHSWFREMGEHLHGMLPQADRVTVPGAGHLVASSHPSEVGRAVVAHIGRHASLPGSGPSPG